MINELDFPYRSRAGMPSVGSHCSQLFRHSPVDPVIKVSGGVDVVSTDQNDDITTPGFNLGMIQVATVFQLEKTSAGRTLSEGHLKIVFRTDPIRAFCWVV